MKILSAQRIREIDQLTIKHNHIESHELMENAAIALCDLIQAHYPKTQHFSLFAGNGNNGGDALALARLLKQAGYPNLDVYLVQFSTAYSADNQYNQDRLKDAEIAIFPLTQPTINKLPSNSIIIDALFGTGLNRPLEGDYAKLVDLINASGNEIIAIDLPSGLYADQSNPIDNSIVQADITFTFQIPKWALFMPDNATYIGNWQLLDIGLDKKAIEQSTSEDSLITAELIQSLYRPRQPWSHKGKYGHALLIAGSYGKLGALALSTQACLRSGSGLTTCYAPSCAFEIMQGHVPSAMFLGDDNPDYISAIPDIERYDSIGIGPGIGTEEKTAEAVKELLQRSKVQNKKVLVDADALNLIAANPTFQSLLHEHCVLTPHPKEFARLAGNWQNDYQKRDILRQFAKDHHCIVVLKDRYTCIADINGHIYVNNSGNAGLAKGGSGDTLSGIITALLAQGYSPLHAALFGVHLHGLAADMATLDIAQESLLAEDVCHYLSDAFNHINGAQHE